MTSDKTDALHLVERINIDLVVQNSIVPSALSLARIKVAGSLPTLQLNLSDVKYKSLMRLVDVCIPKFGDDIPRDDSIATTFASRSGFFSQIEPEYTVEEEKEDDDEGEDDTKDEFYEASEGLPDVRALLSDIKTRLTVH